MAPGDRAFRIRHNLAAIAKIQRDVSDMDIDPFANDEEIMEAGVHSLTAIGEKESYGGKKLPHLLPKPAGK